jgi:DNA-binding transcriptional MerR regulator
MQPLLTLSEFAAAAANAVQASGVVPDNRQAKPIPAERMIRYYTARGLLPRPGTRGRALTYGRTHLLRLVAIKRLQGEGLSLDEIARRLDGLSPTELEALAAIPAAAMPAGLGDPEIAAARARAAGRFWEAAPDPAPAPVPAAAAAVDAGPPAVSNLHAVRLSDTVTLLIDATVDPLPALDALRAAAAPLLDLLATPDHAPDSGKDEQ